MRFKERPQLIRAGRTRACHHYGSQTLTSPEPVLLSKMACHPKHFGPQCIFKVLAKLQPIWSYSVLLLQRSLIQPKKVVYYNSLWQETFEILTLGPSFITSALFLAFLEPTHLKYDIRFFENSPTYFFVHIKVYLRFAHRTDHMHIAHALCRLFFCFMIFVAAVNQKVYFFIFILFMLKSAFCLLQSLE